MPDGKFDMLTQKLCTILILLLTLICPAPAASQDIEIPSSFNPVGSGARAIGMGGAFIAMADDATAASWNPGGLIQLTMPEFSMVFNGLHRKEGITFKKQNPEETGRTVFLRKISIISVQFILSDFLTGTWCSHSLTSISTILIENGNLLLTGRCWK